MSDTDEKWTGTMTKRSAGDWSGSSHNRDDIRFPWLKEFVQKRERKHKSFTLAFISKVNADVEERFGTTEEAVENRVQLLNDLASIYHYYIHGPEGRAGAKKFRPKSDDVRKMKALAKVEGHPFNIGTQHKVKTKRASINVLFQCPHVDQTFSLADITNDAESIYLSKAKAEFRFWILARTKDTKQRPSSTQWVPGIAYYYPIIGQQESLPSAEHLQKQLNLTETDNEHGVDHEELRKIRDEFKAFYASDMERECRFDWQGRGIPFAAIDLPFFRLPAIRNYRHRIKCKLSLNDAFTVHPTKQCLEDDGVLSQSPVLTLKTSHNHWKSIFRSGSRPGRSTALPKQLFEDAQKEFRDWAKECHDILDRPFTLCKRLSTNGSYRELRVGTTTFEVGQVIRLKSLKLCKKRTELFGRVESFENGEKGVESLHDRQVAEGFVNVVLLPEERFQTQTFCFSDTPGFDNDGMVKFDTLGNCKHDQEKWDRMTKMATEGIKQQSQWRYPLVKIDLSVTREEVDRKYVEYLQRCAPFVPMDFGVNTSDKNMVKEWEEILRMQHDQDDLLKEDSDPWQKAPTYPIGYTFPPTRVQVLGGKVRKGQLVLDQTKTMREIECSNGKTIITKPVRIAMHVTKWEDESGNQSTTPLVSACGAEGVYFKASGPHPKSMRCELSFSVLECPQLLNWVYRFYVRPGPPARVRVSDTSDVVLRLGEQSETAIKLLMQDEAGFATVARSADCVRVTCDDVEVFSQCSIESNCVVLRHLQLKPLVCLLRVPTTMTLVAHVTTPSTVSCKQPPSPSVSFNVQVLAGVASRVALVRTGGEVVNDREVEMGVMETNETFPRLDLQLLDGWGNAAEPGKAPLRVSLECLTRSVKVVSPSAPSTPVLGRKRRGSSVSGGSSSSHVPVAAHVTAEGSARLPPFLLSADKSVFEDHSPMAVKVRVCVPSQADVRPLVLCFKLLPSTAPQAIDVKHLSGTVGSLVQPMLRIRNEVSELHLSTWTAEKLAKFSLELSWMDDGKLLPVPTGGNLPPVHIPDRISSSTQRYQVKLIYNDSPFTELTTDFSVTALPDDPAQWSLQVPNAPIPVGQSLKQVKVFLFDKHANRIPWKRHPKLRPTMDILGATAHAVLTDSDMDTGEEEQPCWKPLINETIMSFPYTCIKAFLQDSGGQEQPYTIRVSGHQLTKAAHDINLVPGELHGLQLLNTLASGRTTVRTRDSIRPEGVLVDLCTNPITQHPTNLMVQFHFPPDAAVFVSRTAEGTRKSPHRSCKIEQGYTDCPALQFQVADTKHASSIKVKVVVVAINKARRSKVILFETAFVLDVELSSRVTKMSLFVEEPFQTSFARPLDAPLPELLCRLNTEDDKDFSEELAADVLAGLALGVKVAKDERKDLYQSPVYDASTGLFCFKPSEGATLDTSGKWLMHAIYVERRSGMASQEQNFSADVKGSITAGTPVKMLMKCDGRQQVINNFGSPEQRTVARSVEFDVQDRCDTSVKDLPSCGITMQVRPCASNLNKRCPDFCKPGRRSDFSLMGISVAAGAKGDTGDFEIVFRAVSTEMQEELWNACVLPFRFENGQAEYEARVRHNAHVNGKLQPLVAQKEALDRQIKSALDHNREAGRLLKEFQVGQQHILQRLPAVGIAVDERVHDVMSEAMRRISQTRASLRQREQSSSNGYIRHREEDRLAQKRGFIGIMGEMAYCRSEGDCNMCCWVAGREISAVFIEQRNSEAGQALDDYQRGGNYKPFYYPMDTLNYMTYNVFPVPHARVHDRPECRPWRDAMRNGHLSFVSDLAYKSDRGMDEQRFRAIMRTVFSNAMVLDTLNDATEYRRFLVRNRQKCPTLYTRDGHAVSAKGRFGGSSSRMPARFNKKFKVEDGTQQRLADLAQVAQAIERLVPLRVDLAEKMQARVPDDRLVQWKRGVDELDAQIRSLNQQVQSAPIAAPSRVAHAPGHSFKSSSVRVIRRS